MSKLDKKMSRLKLPAWLPVVYGALAVGLVPWTVNLSSSLPYRYVSHNWNVSWVGFDLLLLGVICLTAYFAVKQSGWIVLSSISAAALLVADAWMDVWTSRPGHAFHTAIIIALFVEIPLAVLSLWLSIRVARHLMD